MNSVACTYVVVDHNLVNWLSFRSNRCLSKLDYVIAKTHSMKIGVNRSSEVSIGVETPTVLRIREAQVATSS